MHTRFTTKAAVVSDWIEDAGIAMEEIDEGWLYKLIDDVVKWTVPQGNTEQHSHKLIILPVRNHKAELPADFTHLAQIACRISDKKECTRFEQVSQWAKNTWDPECELEINLKCASCHKRECNCDYPAVEVDVDRIWLASNPQYYYDHFVNRVGRWGYGDNSSSFTPEFKLMNYASSDMFGLSHHIPNCPNLGCGECERTYRLDLPFIEVDFERGELLVSYFGRRTDEDGELMVPNHPDFFQAVFWYLEYKYFWRRFRREGKPQDRVRYVEAEQRFERYVGIARGAMDILDWPSMKNLFQKLARRIPSYKDDMNLRKVTKTQEGKYNKFLRRGTPDDRNIDY